jgi:hypothetical protein
MVKSKNKTAYQILKQKFNESTINQTTMYEPIAHGIKDIENRTWKTHFRGRIYIHASAKYFKTKAGWELLNEEQFKTLKDDDFT